MRNVTAGVWELPPRAQLSYRVLSRRGAFRRDATRSPDRDFCQIVFRGEPRKQTAPARLSKLDTYGQKTSVEKD